MSSLPRIEFEQLPEELAAILGPRAKRLGYLGEFFKCAAHQPEALGAFVAFTESGKRALPPRLVEVIALTVAGWMDNQYERNQHERLSVRSGFGREWVAEVNAAAPDAAALMTAPEKRIQALVLAILESHGKSAQRLFDDCVREFGPGPAMATLMVMGRYVVHTLIVNTLALKPPVPSIFEDGFNG